MCVFSAWILVAWCSDLAFWIKIASNSLANDNDNTPAEGKKLTNGYSGNGSTTKCANAEELSWIWRSSDEKKEETNMRRKRTNYFSSWLGKYHYLQSTICWFRSPESIRLKFCCVQNTNTNSNTHTWTRRGWKLKSNRGNEVWNIQIQCDNIRIIQARYVFWNIPLKWW